VSKQEQTAGPFDVFLSHAAQDEPLATLIKQRMEDFGLCVFAVSPVALQRSAEASEAVRQALLGSRAFVALLTPGYENSPALLLEFGAAWQQGLPIHILVSGSEVSDVPAFMRGQDVRTLADLSDMIAEMVGNSKPVLAGRER
jgi:hypothetical protein